MDDQLRKRIGVVVSVAVVILIGIGGLSPIGAVAAVQISAADDPTPAADLPPDQGAALAQAEQSGKPVVVDALTTETTQVTAQPDGLMHADISSRPERHQVDGQWINLDPTLEFAGDAVISRQGLGDLRLSAGGPTGTRLASYVVAGYAFSIYSPVMLPRPVLSGTIATYADVLPGVDIVVQATGSSFSYNWVIKNSDAAQNPELRRIAMRVDAPGLTPRADRGGVSYVSADGVSQLWSPAPLMWDSASVSGDNPANASDGEQVQSSVAAVDGGPSMIDNATSLDVATTPSAVTIAPDPAILDSPSTVYPVVIDPTTTVPRAVQGWTAVWSNLPTTGLDPVWWTRFFRRLPVVRTLRVNGIRAAA